jgi:hypothetical protein
MPFGTNVIIKVNSPVSGAFHYPIAGKRLVLYRYFYRVIFNVVASLGHVLSCIRVYRIRDRYIIRTVYKLHSKFWDRRLGN